MSIDLIKEYLIGIGFNVNPESFKKAKDSIKQTDETIKKFNNNSNKGFSETSGSLKDLISVAGTFSDGFSKLSGMDSPLSGAVKDISTLIKMYGKFKEISKKSNIQSNSKTPPKPKTTVSKKNANASYTLSKKTENKPGLVPVNKKKMVNTNIVDQILNAKEASKALGEDGAKSIEKFSLKAIGKFALIGTAIVGVIAGIGKLLSSISDLANQDIGYEKLSRQLWTTKENAKEIDMSLKTLGASMQDLWLSPTLLKQFNQLRKDSKDLKLPPEFNKNLKTVQDISFEFKRFKQLLSMFFQWIGNYILKYCSGPLNDVKNGMKSFNNWLKENIPGIAKVIGTIIGVLARILMYIFKIIAVVGKIFLIPLKLIGKLISAIGNIPKPIKNILKLLALLAAPLLLVIGIIDDILTYFRGGKSVIGKYIDKIKDKCKNAGSIIKGIITVIKAILTGGLSLLPWDKYWEKAKETFEKIRDKAKETWEKVKEWSKGKLESAKEFISGAKDKVNNFMKGEDKATVSQSYVTSNNSSVSNNTTETKNSNNKVSNQNVINVYGGSDAKSTANAVNKNLAGITTRSLQGVY